MVFSRVISYYFAVSISVARSFNKVHLNLLVKMIIKFFEVKL